MKRLIDYYLEAVPAYEYEIRMCVEPTENHLSLIEAVLMRYDLKELCDPVRMMFSPRPYGFPNIAGCEVYRMKVVTGQPVSEFHFREELCKINKFLFNHDNLIMRDPAAFSMRHEFNQEAYNDMVKDAADNGEQPLAVHLDDDHSDVDQKPDMYGTAHNNRLLNQLEKNRKAREEANAEAMPKHPMSDWLEPEKPEYVKDDGQPDASGPKPEYATTDAGFPLLQRSYTRRFVKNGKVVSHTKEA